MTIKFNWRKVRQQNAMQRQGWELRDGSERSPRPPGAIQSGDLKPQKALVQAWNKFRTENPKEAASGLFQEEMGKPSRRRPARRRGRGTRRRRRRKK